MSTQGESSSAPSRRVLVVDDNEDSVDSMVMLLELLGNQVYTARDGIEAIESAERFRPDLVLMDMGMPRMNGYDATRRIREQLEKHHHRIDRVLVVVHYQDAARRRARALSLRTHIDQPLLRSGLPWRRDVPYHNSHVASGSRLGQ